MHLSDMHVVVLERSLTTVMGLICRYGESLGGDR